MDFFVIRVDLVAIAYSLCAEKSGDFPSEKTNELSLVGFVSD